MPSKTLKAAIIGCGRIGGGLPANDGSLGIYTHAQGYQACDGVELLAVCDIDAGQAESCARRWNIPRWYTDPRLMMQETRPDLVSLCTPDETHVSLALQLLDFPTALRGLLCEKPIAVNLAEAKRVLYAAQKKDVIVAVNYMRRYLPNIRRVREVLRGGELGAVKSVHGWYTKGVLHNGTHWFDLVRYLLTEVSRASGRIVHDKESPDPGVDVTLELADGSVARLTSCDARQFTVFEMDIMLEKGRLELRDAALQPRLWMARPGLRFAGHTELMEEDLDFGAARDPLKHAIADLIAAVNEGRTPACSGADGLAALAIGEAALASARSGGHPVSVERCES